METENTDQADGNLYETSTLELSQADDQLQRIYNRLTELRVDLAKMIIEITMQNNADLVRHIYEAEQKMQTVISSGPTDEDGAG